VSQGDSEQAGLEEPSDAASKKRRLREPSDTASKKKRLDSRNEANQSPNRKRLRLSRLPGSAAIYETETAVVRCVLLPFLAYV